MTEQVFSIFQFQEGYETELLYETYDEELAQDCVDRINANLAAAGIPSSESRCYYR